MLVHILPLFSSANLRYLFVVWLLQTEKQVFLVYSFQATEMCGSKHNQELVKNRDHANVDDAKLPSEIQRDVKLTELEEI